VLQALMHEHLKVSPDPTVQAGIARLEQGAVLAEIGDFFGLFPAVYAITSTPAALRTVARAVLGHFLDPAEDGFAECTYLELRTGPRATPQMTRRAYLEAVLDEVERYPADTAALIVSFTRETSSADMGAIVELAIELKNEGRRVVGIDVCGDPFGGDVKSICQHIRTAKDAGLRVTLHIAEVASSLLDDEQFSSPPPIDGQEPQPRDNQLLGHATRSTRARNLPQRRGASAGH
jgi:adenosine deaminase